MKKTIFLTALILITLYFASCDLASDLRTPVTPVYTEQDSIVNFLEPDNNVTLPQDSVFTIKWYLCNNAYKYELQFSTDSLFTSQSSNFISSPQNIYNRNSGNCSSCTYFYRIRAYFPPNNTSELYWSEIKKYNTTQ